MKTVMEKNTIITLKLQGKSNRLVSKATGFNRKTVARHWSDYQKNVKQLSDCSESNIHDIQEQMYSRPKYDTAKRKPVKYTMKIDAAIETILAGEKEKARELGESHKQKLTNKQIHGLLRLEGYDIGLTVASAHIREKRNKTAEAFIKQEYDYGDRVEYDFGEVKLVIGGEAKTYYLAVFGAPRASFRWAYLYKNQKKAVFLDSHVRFFDMAGGVYREVVYDNMKNVVTRFIGKSEKELNTDLIAMSTYYGFIPNVTNCFRGNEKGYVESSVKEIRKEVYTVRYRFDSVEEAEEHLYAELDRINASSEIAEEKKYLLPWRPPLELSKITEQGVDKYSFVRVENNFYSVPEYLVGRKVIVRNYIKDIAVYSGVNLVCTHIKKDGCGETSVNILHYLDTLAKKPGAIKNSKALRDKAELKAVFDNYYTKRAREFIDILRDNKDKPSEAIVRLMIEAGEGRPHIRPEGISSNVMNFTRGQLFMISDYFMKGDQARGY